MAKTSRGQINPSPFWS